MQSVPARVRQGEAIPKSSRGGPQSMQHVQELVRGEAAQVCIMPRDSAAIPLQLGKPLQREARSDRLGVLPEVCCRTEAV